jgi:hypothetical protein
VKKYKKIIAYKTAHSCLKRGSAPHSSCAAKMPILISLFFPYPFMLKTIRFSVDLTFLSSVRETLEI